MEECRGKRGVEKRGLRGGQWLVYSLFITVPRKKKIFGPAMVGATGLVPPALHCSSHKKDLQCFCKLLRCVSLLSTANIYTHLIGPFTEETSGSMRV